MGAIAGRLVELGGNVHGIIPKALLEYETTTERPSYGRTTVVGDMHTRKRLMAKEADAFIALPGGFGTMEELMEVCPPPYIRPCSTFPCFQSSSSSLLDHSLPRISFDVC